MSQELASVLGLCLLVAAFVAGVARRRTFPSGQVVLGLILAVIAIAALLLVALLIT